FTVLLFFFSLFPPPPCFTLFPYTTLFRSRCSAIPARSTSQRWLAADFFGPPQLATHRPLRCATAHSPAGLDRNDIGSRPFRPARDRKSTRLNSSHLVISYAVFCLKKKKKN